MGGILFQRVPLIIIGVIATTVFTSAYRHRQNKANKAKVSPKI